MYCKGTGASFRLEKCEASQNAWNSTPNVQWPEALSATGREKARISEVQSHNARGNTKYPQLIQEDGPQDELLQDGYGNEEQEEELS